MPRFGHCLIGFDASIVVSLQSSSCLTPDPVNAGPFHSAHTTMALVHSAERRFEVRSCEPTSKGRPSSVKQLRTIRSRELLALMAHDHRLSGSYLVLPQCRTPR